MNIKEQK